LELTTRSDESRQAHALTPRCVAPARQAGVAPLASQLEATKFSYTPNRALPPGKAAAEEEDEGPESPLVASL